MRELLREDDDERETLLLLLLLIFICGWFRIWPSIEDVGCYAIHRNDE
jgi:hypothetical protein